jgi:hypothetical protein
MNSLNLEPGLRKAFNNQTHQRLLAESTQARLVKSVSPENKHRIQLKQYPWRLKIKHISTVLQDAASAIITIMRASSYSANA